MANEFLQTAPPDASIEAGQRPEGWSYERVLNLHNKAKAAGLIDEKTTLPQFAQQLNDDTGTSLFSAGLHDSKLKRGSVAFDTLLKKTTIPEKLSTTFGDIGSLISPEAEKTGAKVGENFLRGALDTAAILGGMSLTSTGVGAVVGIPMMAAGGVSTYSKTLTETDSPVAGLIQTGASFALPKFMSAGAKALSPIGKAIGGDVATTIVGGSGVEIPVSKAGMGLAERSLDFLGLNLGAAANQELAQQATSVTTGHGLFNPLSREHAFELALGNIPFLPFQVRDILRGPGKGEFRSFGELARAQEATQILDKATRETAARAYLYTAERGDQTNPGPKLYQGGEMPSFTELGDRVISATDVSQAQLMAKQQPVAPKNKTLFGKLAARAENVNLIISGEMADVPLLGKGSRPRQRPQKQPIQTVEQAAQNPVEIVKAADTAVKVPIRTAADLEATGKLTNEAARANGSSDPVVTDQSISDKVDQGLEDGLNPAEAVSRAAQSTQNRLNRVAAELGEKLTKAQQTSQAANETLNALPEKAQSLIGKVITDMSKRHESTMDTDLSDAWTQASVKWAQDPKNQELINAEDQSAAVSSLEKTLAGTAKLKTLERTRNKTISTGGGETIFSTEQPGTLRPEVEKLSENGKETFGDIVKAENEVIQGNKDNLTQDVSVEEAAKYKKGADATYAARLSKVISEFAQGNIERAFSKGKWKFTYHDISNLYDVFKGVSDKAIMNFVRDNHEVIGQVLQDRMGAKFMSFGDLVKERVIIKAGELDKASTPGAFPALAKAWFTHHFLNKGVNPTEAARLSDIAMRLAAVYPEISATRLTGLITDLPIFGVTLSGMKNGVIGINEVSQIAGLTHGPLEQFLKLHVLAHEQFHALWDSFGKGELSDGKSKVFAAVIDAVSQMTAYDKRHMLNDLLTTIVPKEIQGGAQYIELAKHLVEGGQTSVQEFLATYSGLVTMGVASPSAFKGNYTALREHLLFGDKHLTDFMNNQFLDMMNITEAYKDFLVLDRNVPKGEAELVGAFNNAFKMLASTKADIDNALAKLRFFDNLSNGGLASLLKNHGLNDIQIEERPLGLSDLLGAKWSFSDADSRKLSIDYLAMMTGRKPTSKDLLGLNLNWYERNLVPAAQIAEMYPMTRPIINLGFTFQSVKNKFVTLALTPFMTPDKYGRLVFDEQHSGITKTLHDDKMNEAFSRVCLEQNSESKSLDDNQIAQIGRDAGLDQAGIDVLTQTVKNTRLAMESMAGAMIRSRKDTLAILAGRVILSRDKTLTAQAAYNKGTALVDALVAASGADPAAAAQGAQALTNAQAAINNPEAFGGAVQAVTALLPKYVEFAKTVSDRPWYTPEVRLGNFKLRWKEGDTTKFIGLKTKAEFEARLKELNENPNIDSQSIRGYEKFDQNNDSYLLSSNMVQKYAAIEQAAFDMRKAMFPEDADSLNKLGYIPGEAAFKEATAQGIGKYTIRRKLVGGREELNFMEGVLDYVTGVSGGLAKGYTRDLAALYLADPTLQANPKVQALLRDHIASVTSSPKEWTAIKNAVFHFTLGGNISSILVERLQPLFSLVPHLTQYGAGIAGSYKYMGKAMKTLWQIASKDKSGIDPSLRIPEMLERASKDRVVDFGIYQELAGQEDVAVTNLRNLATSNPGVNTAASLLTKPLFWYTRFARNLYTRASSQNSRIAFLASYLMAMDKGINGQKLNHDQAYQFAADATHTTMFGGGRAGRPIGLFSNLGKTYGAVSAWYMLQHYTTSSIAMMYRLLHDSLGKSGLTPGQTNSSRKALGQMVLTQTLMSGTLGLPLVGGTLAILEQIFPDLQAKKAIRETLAGLAGDDKEMGELISDSFLHGGLPRALGIGMIDLSGRFGLGNVFGIDPEYGFRPESVFGAPGSVLGNILRAGGQVSQGNFSEAIETAAPSGWRNLIRMYNDDWNVRDSQGRLLFEPNEAETVLGAVGFRPKRLAQFREQQQLLQRSDQIAQREMLKFHEDLADVLLSGDTGRVRSLLLQKHQEDPLYDPRAGLHSVVQIAQDKTVPVEPNQGGRASLDEREAISKTFSQVSRPSETNLLLRRKQLERSVGLVGAGSLGRSELTIAQLTDRLLAMNPALGRQLARALVERQLAHDPLRR